MTRSRVSHAYRRRMAAGETERQTARIERALMAVQQLTTMAMWLTDACRNNGMSEAEAAAILARAETQVDALCDRVVASSRSRP